MSTRKLACDLSAIDDDELDIHRENGSTVFEAIDKIHETQDGYAFRLPAESGLIELTAAFIARERLCCPFFELNLKIPANHRPGWLTLGGRDGVKDYIRKTVLPQLEAPVETMNGTPFRRTGRSKSEDSPK